MTMDERDPLENLCANLRRLPGIGSKSARRLAHFLLEQDESRVRELAAALIEARTAVLRCEECCGLTLLSPCWRCAGGRRDRSILCVVEKPQDQEALEAVGIYRGLYHVLHGLISPINGIGPEALTIGRLLQRVDRGDVREVILALGFRVEGEATAVYLEDELRRRGVIVSRIATGIPLGSELEYTDPRTLGRALTERRRSGGQEE